MKYDEKRLSQIPALQLLINLGYDFLTPEEALGERGGSLNNVLLEGILKAQLQKINRITYRGKKFEFSDANINEAVSEIKNIPFEGLQTTNAAVYDLLTLGTSLRQQVGDKTKSYNLKYIDWKNPKNNVFHIVPEFEVERARPSDVQTRRPDIVLFVNGIPLGVVECKAPDKEVDAGVSQQIHYQEKEEIARLFVYAQLLLSINKNAAKYATAGTAKKFWSVWHEKTPKTDILAAVRDQRWQAQKDKLFCGDFAAARAAFEKNKKRQLIEQDKTIYNLCRPQRLLDLVHGFVLVEGKEKKIARYQQYFVVKSALQRIGESVNGRREGGIIWHTQGSGKSLTMVMLVRAIVLNKKIKNPRVVLVTDRKDLDKQLGNTFTQCELDNKRATTGRNLVEHLKNKVGIITTLIHKFEKGMNAGGWRDESENIFVLVDESHRSNFGGLAAAMRRMLPNACFIGFTGTPLLRQDKNNIARFGGFIKPNYPIRQAVADKAVLPLLYEGRFAEIKQDKQAIDAWFGRHTEGLNDRQKADLKRKYARAGELNKTDAVVAMRAYDISAHYTRTWKGTGHKAQLVAPDKATALKYDDELKSLGMVSSEVIISAPNVHEGYEEVDEEPNDAAVKFWQKMMNKYGREEEYLRQITENFRSEKDPEILIVVDKLLTGFDAPRNTVLYLCRKLREHTLLQAIARVNRLFDDKKEYGYILDYERTLKNLEEAFNFYDTLAGFDEEDLAGTLTAVNQVVAELPQCRDDLLGFFRGVDLDNEDQAERFLKDEARRKKFYDCFNAYAKHLKIALSTEKFLSEVSDKELGEYKKCFNNFKTLRGAVFLRYADGIKYREHEKKIQDLLNKQIKSDNVRNLTDEPIYLTRMDDRPDENLRENTPDYMKPGAAADAIAHILKKAVIEKMEQDPAFYSRFSEMIERAINAFENEILSDIEYLNQMREVQKKMNAGQRDDVPAAVRDNGAAAAYFGELKRLCAEESALPAVNEDILCKAALAIDGIIKKAKVVDYWKNETVINDTKNEIDDFLCEELRDKHNIPLEDKYIAEAIKRILHIAQKRGVNL